MDFLALKNLFWLLPIVLGAIAIGSWAYLQRKKAIALLTQNAEACNLQSNASPIRRRILASVLFSALILAAFAALRPAAGFVQTEHQRPSKNLIILLDVSTSMTANDSEGISRSDAAKLLLRSFIQKRPTDKIGMISFAGNNFIESPITLDRSVLLKRINQAKPGPPFVPGTNINAALEEAQSLLTENPPPGSAILIFSDGDNVTGTDPQKTLSQLKKSNLPVISIALGKDGLPAIIPGTETTTSAVHATLRQLSDATNGLFFTASPKDVEAQVTKLSDRVDTIEINGENIAGELFERPLDIYAWPLSFALLCLMIHLFLPLRTKRWHPLATVIALLLCLTPALPAEQVASYDRALVIANEEELPVLVIFTGSDWSKLSITFESEILKHQVFEKWADTKVVWTLIDLPRVGLDDDLRRERRTLMQKLDVETFPMAVFLDSQENILGTLTHDPEGPDSWTKRADAILAGDTAESDTAASAEYLPEEVRNNLEDPNLTDAQRSIGYYNKALELEKAEPELTLKSKDRFELLTDLYTKAADAAPADRKDLIFPSRHNLALLHHRKGQSLIPKSEQEMMQMAMAQETDPVSLLKQAKRSFKTALRIYKNTAALKPGDEELSDNLALVYQNLNRTQAYLEFLEAYQTAIENTSTALDQERRFIKSLEREVNTQREVNRKSIEESVNAIQDLIAKSEAIEDSPTILPAEGLKDYRLADEDIVLAPSPHRERELEKSAQHIQDALDHLIDPQQMQPQPQQGEGEGDEEGEGEGKGEGENEGEGKGGRQRENQGDNPQGDRPGDQPGEGEGEGGKKDGDKGQKNNAPDSELKRAEQEGGDLRQRLLRKQQNEYFRKGRRVPPSKRH